MRVQNPKILTGMMLSVLLSAVSVAPALAQQMDSAPRDGRDASPMEPMNLNQGQQMNQPMAGQSVTGRITNITGERVMMEMPDGTTQEVTIAQQDIRDLNLAPGMDISLMLDDQNVATNVNLADTTATDTTGTNTNTTLRREEQTIQRRTTVETVPQQRTVQNAPAQTTTPMMDEVQQTDTQSRPVRALW